MVKFLDGPAAGQVLTLRRAPIVLRAVRAGGGTWDALDQLDDSAGPGETIHVYLLVGEPTYMHLLRSPRRFSGWFALAQYRLLPWQPTDAEARTNTAWGAWCEANRERVMKIRNEAQNAHPQPDQDDPARQEDLQPE